jgi:hypothetical protein
MYFGIKRWKCCKQGLPFISRKKINKISFQASLKWYYSIFVVLRNSFPCWAFVIANYDPTLFIFFSTFFSNWFKKLKLRLLRFLIFCFFALFLRNIKFRFIMHFPLEWGFCIPLRLVSCRWKTTVLSRVRLTIRFHKLIIIIGFIIIKQVLLLIYYL